MSAQQSNFLLKFVAHIKGFMIEGRWIMLNHVNIRGLNEKDFAKYIDNWSSLDKSNAYFKLFIIWTRILPQAIEHKTSKDHCNL